MADTTYSPKVYRKHGGDELVVASGGKLTVEAGGYIEHAMVSVTAATLTATKALHHNRVVALNKADGQTITLPAATGAGTSLLFIVGTAVTSVGTVIKVASASDIMGGFAIQSQDGGNTLQMFETASDSDTITFDGSTTGGKVGDRVTLVDIASGVWAVQVICAATGSEATPFSATVS